SRSTTVTSAPSRAASVAAWCPAGPPPRTTNRMLTRPRLRPWSSDPVHPVPAADERSQPSVLAGAGDEDFVAPRRRVGRHRVGVGDVRAVRRRVLDEVAALADPLEVHPVGHEEVAAP